jgi:hypothetical protein
MFQPSNAILIAIFCCLCVTVSDDLLAQRRHMASIDVHPSMALGRMGEVTPYPFSFGGGYEFALGKKMDWAVRAEIQYFRWHESIDEIALESPTGHVTQFQIKHFNEMVLPLFSVRKYFQRHRAVVPYAGAGFGKANYFGSYEILDPLDPEGCEPEFFLGSYDAKPWFMQFSAGVDIRLATKTKRTTSISVGLSYTGSNNEIVTMNRGRSGQRQTINRKSELPQTFIHILTGEAHYHDIPAWYNSPLQMLQLNISIRNFFGKAVASSK